MKSKLFADPVEWGDAGKIFTLAANILHILVYH